MRKRPADFPRERTWLLAVGLVGVATALIVAAARWNLEAQYHTVEIVLDGPDWHALAVAEGLSPDALLKEARARGATSVAVYERTLKRMAEGGELAYFSAGEIATLVRAGSLPRTFAPAVEAGLHAGAIYVAAGPETTAFLQQAFGGLLGASRVRRTGGILQILGLKEDLEEAGLGFAPQDLLRYRTVGLIPVLRLRNYAGLTEQGLQYLIDQLRRLGSGYTVLFEFNEVLGFERLIDQTAEALRGLGARYARIEAFSERRKQRGEDRFTQRIRPDVIRLFSLTPEELQLLSPDDARGKFVLAARERNIRMLYVRPLVTSAGLAGSEVNLEFVHALAADLHRFGLQNGQAAPLPVLDVPRALSLIISAGAIALLVYALAVVAEAVGAPVPVAWLWGISLAGAMVTLGVFFAGGFLLWRKLLALGVAATVPAVLVAALLPPAGRRPAVQALRVLWIASAGAALAGVVVAGLLSEWEFMLAADGFTGVKLAHVVPVLLIVILLWRRDRPAQTWRDTLREAWAWSGRPLLLRYAIAAVVVGVAAVVLLARSGNFGFPLLGIEDRLRTLAEQWLVVRPRTKEYLIGHPALILAGAAAALGWRAWVLPLAAVGVIGQAGIINSFSHLHTPLLYTIWRTLNALVIGNVLGLVAVWVLTTVSARTAGPRPPASRRR
ncbi:MAG TPA: DUF5693 family protein [bacterium]